MCFLLSVTGNVAKFFSLGDGRGLKQVSQILVREEKFSTCCSYSIVKSNIPTLLAFIAFMSTSYGILSPKHKKKSSRILEK